MAGPWNQQFLIHLVQDPRMATVTERSSSSGQKNEHGPTQRDFLSGGKKRKLWPDA